MLADKLISDSEVKARAAQIYEREQKNRKQLAPRKSAGNRPSSQTIKKIASAADVATFAAEYFGGDEAKAREYLKQKGYAIQ